MSQLLAELSAQGLMQGLNPDLKGDQAPLLVDGGNLQFSSQAVTPYPGAKLKFTKPSSLPVLGVLSTLISSIPTIFWGTKEKIYRWTEADGVDEVGTGYTGGDGDLWTFQRWGTWVLATNGVDPPQIYKGVSFAAIDLTGAPFATCKVLMAWAQFMFAFGCDTGDTRVVMSDRDDPEEYISALTNFATFKDLRDTTSGIRAALLLNGRLVCYTENELHVVNYLGPPNFLGTQKLLDGIGVRGPFAVCEVNRMHYGVGPRGIWKTDGASWNPVGHSRVQDEFFAQINPLALDRVVCWHDQRRRHVVFFYAVEGSLQNSRAVAYNYLYDNWTKLSFGRSAVSDSGIFDGALLGDFQGNIWEVSNINSPSGEAEGKIDVADGLTMDFGVGELGVGNLSFGGFHVG